MRTQFKFTLGLICTPEYKYTPEYIYTRVFFAHANWTLVYATINEPQASENRYSGFPTRSDTNRSVQSQKNARSLKIWI